MNTARIEEQIIQRIVSQKGKLAGKKILWITEYIDTGDTVRRIGEILQMHGIGFDIAVLAKANREEKLKLPAGTRVFVGDSSAKNVPRIHGELSLTGLRKADWDGNAPTVIRHDSYVKERVSDARSDVNLLVRKVTMKLHTL